MGRPLAKRFFGNRNIGSASTATDNGIGGEGIASINWSNLGAWRNGPVTGLALPAPTLPTGVQSTWTLRYSVAGVVTSAGKTNLAVGWEGTNTSIPGLVVRVTSVSGSNALFEVKTQATPLATIPFSGNGQGVTFTHSNSTGTATTFLTDVNWQVDASTVITQKGSGYTGAETFTVTVGSGTAPAGTIVLTTDSTTQTGAQGNANNQENAIIAYAKTTTGGSTLVADIQKQEGSRRYRVVTSDGAAVCNLTTGTTSLAAKQLYIVATDENNSTYYVKKLTAHRATLWRKATSSSYAYVNNGVAKWSFSAATTGTVYIANA